MRALFTCTGEYGHLHPHLPLARALVSAGHQVVFATPDSFRPRVESAGFATLPVPPDRAEVAGEIARRFPSWSEVTAEQRFRFSLVNVGAQIVAPMMVEPLLGAIEDWKADLLVHGPAVLAGPLAARVAGIPSVNQSWGALLPLQELEPAALAVTDLWTARGLALPTFGGLFDYLYLDSAPPSLQDPAVASIAVAHPLRPAPFDAVGDEALPPWVEQLPSRPTVCVTMGTFYNRFTDVFSAVVNGVREVRSRGEKLNVVATVGHDQDPAVLGPQPDNVWVERYIPLSLLLPQCDLLVTHGGSGSVLAAMGEGVPLLVVPQGVDQFANAERCVASGAARAVSSRDLQPGTIAAEVETILSEPRFRHAAREVQDEIRAMPGPEQRVALLEDLASRRRPLGRTG